MRPRCPLPENPLWGRHTCLRPYLLSDHVSNLTDDSIRAAVTSAAGGRLSQETLHRGVFKASVAVQAERKGRG